MSVESNIRWHAGEVTRAEREAQRGHRGVTLWLTGLSGSGKSSIAARLERALFDLGCGTYRLDGDNLRFGLNRDLGFSPEARKENIRRVAEVAKLFTDAGLIVLVAFISPYRSERESVRASMAPGDFVEVFVDAALEVCEARDPKGLYRKARQGEITNFTGIDAPYEAPLSPELHLRSDRQSVDELVGSALEFLRSRGYLQP